MAKVMFTARIEAEEEEFLRDLGGGDRTAGFRLLIARGIQAQQQRGGPVTAPLPARVIQGRLTTAPAFRAAASTPTAAPKTAPVPQPTASRMRFVGRK